MGATSPFDKPETGKIAVKVINHYGDEVLKVFGVNNYKNLTRYCFSKVGAGYFKKRLILRFCIQ